MGSEEADFTALAEELHEMSVAKGGVIFEQNTKADGFYLIYAGSVRITRRVDKTETQRAQLVRNDYFGEMALVANRPRSATVTALTDTTLLMLPKADFSTLYKRAPQIETNLEIAVRSRQLARQLKFKPGDAFSSQVDCRQLLGGMLRAYNRLEAEVADVLQYRFEKPSFMRT